MPSVEHEGIEVHDSPNPGQAEYWSLAQDLHPPESRPRYPVSPEDIQAALDEVEAARGDFEALQDVAQQLVDRGILKLREDEDSGELGHVVEAALPQSQVVLDALEQLGSEARDANPGGGGEGSPPDRSEDPTVVLPPDGSEDPTVVLPPPESSDPEPDPPAAGRLEFHAANVDREARERALVAAERQLQQEAAEAHGVKGVFQRIWKGALAHEYYRQQLAAKLEAEMRSSDNQLVHEGGSQEAYYRANEALIGRLVEGRINTEMDAHRHEKVERMGESAGEQELQTGIKDIIGRYARGELDAESLREERTRLLNSLHERHPDLLSGAHMVADNLISIAEQAKAMADHDITLQRLIDGMEFYADKVRGGVRSDVHRTLVDKLVERAQGSRLGGFANEATIASAISISYSAVMLASRRTVGAMVATILPGGAAGVFAGARENLRFKQERAQHMRERAEGAVFESGGRREAMERARYETRSARELIEALRLPGGELNTDQAKSLLDSLAEVRARNQISDSSDLDLISFSAVERVDAERFQLDLAVATAKRALRQWYDGAHAADRQSVGGSADRGFDQLLHSQREAAALELRQEVKAKDRIFAKMKAQAVAKAVGKGVIAGLTLGLLVQEGAAFINPNQQGELEGLLGHHDLFRGDQTGHQTLLRSLFASGGEHHAGQEAIGQPFYERIDSHNTVKLPHGFVLRHHGSGKGLTLLEGKHPLARGLHMNEQGFTAHSQEILQKLGIIHEQQLVPVHEAKHVVVSTPVKEFFARHHEGTVHVERTLWYDNDTPNVFDKNELRLWWGGHNDTGLSKDGYVFNVSQMTPDGSYHTPFSADAQALMREGKLRILLSASQDTQFRPISIPIDTHGNAHIAKDSVAGSLFARHNGQAVFRGRFAEVAQVLGHSHGREQVRILATEVGKGVENIRHTVVHSVPAERLVTTLQMPAEHAVRTDWPPVIPINWRREMEPPVVPVRPIYSPGETYSPYVEYAEAPEVSPRLRQNPETSLDMAEEIRWYFEQQQSQDPDYVAELDRYVDESPILNNLPAEARLVVAVPVAAAHESGNIYNTLKTYAAQDREALEQTVFLLDVNWPDDADTDAVNATIREIERAQRNFPELHIASFQHQIPRELIDERNGHIYGSIIKRLYDTAMRSVARSVENGSLSSQDVSLLTNDADVQGLTPHYLRNYINAAERHPEVDMMYGFIRWGTKAFADYPGYAFTATLMQALEHEARKESENYNVNPATWGPNSAFRMASLAAIGGVNGNLGAGADSEVGYRIWRARSAAPVGSGEATAGYEARTATKPRRQVGRVVSAIVDSAPDRILSAYTSGKAVVDSWNNFDDGGFTPRSDLVVHEKENINSDYKQICERIENQMTSLTRWFHDERLVTVALNNVLPPQKGKSLWSMKRSRDGELQVQLTATGRKWLRPRLADRSRSMARRYLARRNAAIRSLERHNPRA